MANPSKAKGTRFEVEVVKYLQAHGYPLAERRALAGSLDRGDLTGVHPDWVFELKNHASMQLASWVDEAKAEMVNAGAASFCVIHKRRGQNVAESYVTLNLATAAGLWIPHA